MTKIIGAKKIDYISKKTSKPVVGVELHVTFDDHNDIGVLVEKIYISQTVARNSGYDCTNDNDLYTLIGKEVSFESHPIYKSITRFKVGD